MYYFGTNLDRKFSIPDFWPTQEQSHKIPTEKEDIRKEVERIRMEIRERKLLREQETDKMREDGRKVLETKGQVEQQNQEQGSSRERLGGLGRLER